MSYCTRIDRKRLRIALDPLRIEPRKPLSTLNPQQNVHDALPACIAGQMR
jgi:hypothetical protein